MNEIVWSKRRKDRIFGFWVITIGLLFTLFSTSTLINQSSYRIRLLICSGFMIGLGTILGYSLIPSSHFIYLIWIMNFLYLISLYGHIGLKNEKSI